MEKFEKTIYSSLEKARRSLTTKQISKRTGISWRTTKNRLKILEKKKLVFRKSFTNRIYWKIKKKKKHVKKKYSRLYAFNFKIWD